MAKYFRPQLKWQQNKIYVGFQINDIMESIFSKKKWK